MSILGIDPGLDGGLVLLDSSGHIERAHVMPTVEVKRGGKNRRDYDITRILEILDLCLPDIVIIEHAMPMPRQRQDGRGQGMTSVFTTGAGFGLLVGLVAGRGLAFEKVFPQSWQRVMLRGAGGTDSKDAAYIVCGRLFPGRDWRATPRCRRPHDGLCDAALIAVWGRRHGLE